MNADAIALWHRLHGTSAWWMITVGLVGCVALPLCYLAVRHEARPRSKQDILDSFTPTVAKSTRAPADRSYEALIAARRKFGTQEWVQ
jgi:hypothetical protein